MDAIFLQLLNGLDKGSAYALIALGLTLIFGTLGVVNFAHGALFMMGGFCAVGLQMLLKLSTPVKDESIPGLEMTVDVPYLQVWFGDTGLEIISYAVPL
jgi:branched-chain amino acid transport system permease protein